MGFPENRCKRALKHFNNNLEIALQHVMSTDETDDDRLFGPEQLEAPQQLKFYLLILTKVVQK